MTEDQITPALDQLAAQPEHMTRLDTREATHYATLTGLLAGLTARTGPGAALAAQLMTETTRCGHTRPRSMPCPTLPPCARPWPMPAAAGRCFPAFPARRFPPRGTATRTPPPIRSRSPAGSAATPA